MAIGYCAKRPVSAVVTFKDGTIVVGGNYCTNPQTTCPRQAGEGYEKCYTICGQLGHAEQVAIRLAVREAALGVSKSGTYASQIASVDVYNHEGPCDACKRMLAVFGIDKVTKFHPLAIPAPIDKETREVIDKEYCLERLGSHSKQQGPW